MSERVGSTEAAAAAFRTLAAAEGAHIPMYARLCGSIADDLDLAGLLLSAPTGQRLPVLVLAALHDLVLEQPDVPLGPWFPSVGGHAGHDGDLDAALHETVAAHRDRLLDRIRHRQVQTNEVNRCVAWRAALSVVCADDDRSLALVEVGASAGLNLGLDRYRITMTGSGLDATLGPSDATVHLATTVRSGSWPGLAGGIPAVVSRIGLDQRPADPADPADARWLTACVWPEQGARLQRLRAALSVTAADPPLLFRGDLVDDLGEVLARCPVDSHVVVLSSWTLAYVGRARRSEFAEVLAGFAQRRAARVTLLTLEADHLLAWVQPPPVAEDAPAEVRHASLLCATSFGPDGTARVTPLARCQAHLAWMDPLVS